MKGVEMAKAATIKEIAPNSKMARAMRAPPNAAEKRAIAEAAKRRIEIESDGDLDFDDDVQEQPIRRRVTRQQTREPTREASRSNGRAGRVVIAGRNGEELTRKRRVGIDPFYIDPAIIPEGWVYQWNAITVLGNQDVLADQNLLMAENGWRPVPADRHPGRYMPPGHKGAIIRGGQRLEERPRALSEEARMEELAAANQLVTDRNEALQLTTMRSRMADGFEMGGKYRGTGGNVRISIDNAVDIPRAGHEIED